MTDARQARKEREKRRRERRLARPQRQGAEGWAFPAEFVREVVPGLGYAAERAAELLDRARQQGHAPGGLFAFVSNDDLDNVVVVFGTRDRFVREDPDWAAEFAERRGGDLLVGIVQGQTQKWTTLGELLSLSRERMRAAEVICNGE